MAAQAKDYSIPSNCGRPIPSWSHTAQEYEALQHFPELGRRFETGPHCLTLKGKVFSDYTVHVHHRKI